MAQRTEIFDLGRLSLTSGEGRRLDLEVPVADFQFGGQRYGVSGASVEAVLDVAHTTIGYSLRLRFEAGLEGPCMRCLEPAEHGVEVDAREIDQPSDADELRSPYLDGEELDVAAWARDALALALPTQIVCSSDCLGLCPVCGENLNTAPPEHAHEPEHGVEVDAREIDQPSDADELRSPYLDGEELDVAAWARDALALALPTQIVCSADCLGLCPVCGENLNTADPEHAHEPEPDPRWAALRGLKLE